MTGPSVLEILARHKEDFSVTVHRIPDRHPRGSASPAPCQEDHIGVFEEDEYRVSEPHCLQTLPIQSGMLRLKSEITGELD